MSHFAEKTIEEIVIGFTLAPLRFPEIIPSILPLVIGAIVLELYFGKHVEESLGWNTSVGNAVIWVTTGLNLLLTSQLSVMERYVSYFIIGLGSLVAYLDFYHKWSDTVAFIISSSGLVYSIAYVTVVTVKTDVTVTPKVLKAGLLFVIGVNIFFQIMQQFEQPVDDGFGANFG